MNDDLLGAGDVDPGIGALFARAFSDAEQVAKAEIELQKARVVSKIDEARTAIFMLLGAVVVSGVALTGLVVGVLMILQRQIGPGWATLIVVGTLALASGLLGWFSLQRFKLLFGAAEAGA